MGTWQDIKGMLKNKKLLLGVAAAGGVGLVVFIRRQQSGQTGDAVSAAATPSGYYAAAPYGSADTTGTDIASFLSGWGSSMLDALKQQQAEPSTSTEPKYRTVTVRGGTHVGEWLMQQGTSLDALKQLNPDIEQAFGSANVYGWLSDANPGTSDRGPITTGFASDMTVKVPI